MQNKFPDKKIALVEQDYFRRTILRERGNTNGLHTKMLENNVKFLLQSGYDVILEGIFDTKLYSKMLKNLVKYNQKTFFFYFDVSLIETLKRSENKPDFRYFGAEKVKSWYKEKDFLNFKNINEHRIPEDFSKTETLEFILQITKL